MTMPCRSCGQGFALADAGDANTLCPPCRRPSKPEPLERHRYDPPGWAPRVVLSDEFLGRD